jgi:3'(2'), 5'-bisphosphate nucleotidase
VSPTLAREAEVAQRLAREAGALQLEVAKKGFAVRLKGPKDPVTEADERSSALIMAGLKAAFPGDAVVSEEAPPPAGKMPDRVWFVDPLDGTQSFVDGRDEYSVMIGLAVRGRPALGVVYKPDGNRLWLGIPGEGAWSDGVPARVAARSEASELTIAVSRHHRGSRHDRLIRKLGVGREATTGSVGLKIALIVDQKADLYLEPGDKTWAWDSCAPEALITAAGGVMTDLAGRPLVYDPSALGNRGGLFAATAACAPLRGRLPESV